MNKTELIHAAAELSHLQKKDVAKIVDAIFQSISTALEKGEKVQLMGFGSFEVRERKERTGRNPQTGETIRIAATKVPVFKPGAQLKQLVK